MSMLNQILQKIKKLKSAILNLLLLAGMIWAGWSAFNMARQAWELRQESQDTEKQIAELALKKEELESYIAELESKQGIEREAKARLNLKLSGEEVVVVVPDEKKEEPENSALWWEKVKKFFLRPLP